MLTLDARVPPSVLVLSAPSGSGKTTLGHMLVSRSEDHCFSVSATTRPPRPGERDGVDYHFVDDDAFRRMVEQGELVEWAEVHGHSYGTPRSEVESAACEGRRVVLDIDVKGALQLRNSGVEALLIFVLPPSAETMVQRINLRNTEGEQEVRQRLRTALEELPQANRFDHIVVNDDLDTCVAGIEALSEGRGTGIDRELDARKIDDLSKGIERIIKEGLPQASPMGVPSSSLADADPPLTMEHDGPIP